MKEFFVAEDFACPCCGQNLIDSEVVCKLNVAFNAMKDRFEDLTAHVTSGYRCEKHNKAVGGARHSLHTMGLAADTIVASPSEDPNLLLRHWFICLIQAGFTGVGQTRKGVGGVAMHADLRHLIKMPPQIWAPPDNLKTAGRYTYFFK